MFLQIFLCHMLILEQPVLEQKIKNGQPYVEPSIKTAGCFFLLLWKIIWEWMCSSTGSSTSPIKPNSRNPANLESFTYFHYMGVHTRRNYCGFSQCITVADKRMTFYKSHPRTVNIFNLKKQGCWCISCPQHCHSVSEFSPCGVLICCEVQIGKFLMPT